MKLLTFSLFFTTIFIIISNNESETTQLGILQAIVKFHNSKLRGYIRLSQQAAGSPVLIRGHIIGLPRGIYTLDVHQNGDTSFNCKKIGPHFGTNALAIIKSNKRRRVYVRSSNNDVCLSGVNGIIGRSLAIHCSASNSAHVDTPVDNCALIKSI